MYKKTILENGIRVVTETVDSVRSVSMGVVIDAGPQDEAPDQSGLAHLVEHIMFQGTSSRDAIQIARMIDSAGGQMGGFTTRDYTCYSATVLDDYHTYALDLLGDILLNSIFPDDSLEREKLAIMREIDGSRDIPDERAHDLLKSFAWSGHPLGRPIAGTPDSVRMLTREDVIYFVHENYLPTRIIIAGAGNVEHEDFVAQVRDAFWRMLHPPPLPDGKEVQEKVPYQSGVVIEHMPVSQAYFSIGIRAKPYAHPDRYGLYVLNNVLGSGISSRLFRRIREERGLVYEIDSDYHAYQDDGMLIIEGSTSPEYLMQVLGLTLVELWKLMTGDDAADEDEFWKAKMNIRGQHIISGENMGTRMSRLATQELYFGRHILTEDVLSHIETVDAGVFRRMADESLTDALRKITIAVVGPEMPEHYSISSVQDLLDSFNK
ncbi:pitrilysin family protein [Desulfococcaceae bacterium HSG8]|nr:pitrilysin family protein [Desulfococcaceae bacterium HSG8]